MKANKILLTAVAPIGLMSVSPLCSCSCGPTKVVYAHEAKFFKTPSISQTIYVIDPYKISTNADQWYVTLQSLQGILAQTQAQIFVKSNESDRNQWFDTMKQKIGFKTVDINDYKAFLKAFAPVFENKYVLYRDNTGATKPQDYSVEINKATTIAAAKQVLMVEEKLVSEIEALGFTKAYDARNYTTKELFNTFKGDLNKTMFINQKPTNSRLRDYAIASKSLTTFLEWVKDPNGENDEETYEAILDWADDNCPILGWPADEISFVAEMSKHNKVVIASDHCCNLSFYSVYDANRLFKQKRAAKIKPQQGKHYVAIVMSDGDNIQWMQNNFATSQDYYGSSYRGKFPMTWTLSPSPFDVNESTLDKIYDSQTINDNFICGPSGYGYINYEMYPKADEFADITAKYLQDTDIKICNFIDNEGGVWREPEIFEQPMLQKQIDGGVWSFGRWYIEGQGGVHWINDKPIVCAREALWELDGASEEDQFMNIKNVANRINKYPTDPSDINGYTIVLAHAWSYGKMPNINEFVDKLNDHVVLVTAEQLIDMVANNVEHTDVYATDDNGWNHRTQ